jgi:dephospho-CoA kinase
LRAFARHGAAVLSSDEIVHRLIAEDPEVRAALLDRFGTTERDAIAAIVFEDSRALGWLERLLHPRVQAEYTAWRDEVAQSPDPPGVAVVEIPLLYETGSDARFDAVVVITAPEDVRAARSRVRPDSRGKRLLGDEEKIRRATYAYVNDGTLTELDAFVAGVVRALAGVPA